MMKILIDARSLGEKPSGIGMYLYRFAKGLSGCSDIRLSLVTDIRESAEIRELEEQYHIPVYAYGRAIRKGPDLWRYFHFLRKTMDQVRPDIFWEVNNLLPVRLRNPYGKYVVTIHDIFPLTLPEQHSRLFCLYFRYGIRKTIGCCDAVLFDSQTMRDEIVSRFPRLKRLPQYVSYVITPDHIRTGMPRGDYFLYVGNLEKRKGTDLLLEAYRRYRQGGGTRELYLAGKLRDRDIEAQLRRLKEELGGVHELGYISDDERNRLYQECRCLLFPSRAEGFGMPLIEALSCAAPVVASRLPVFEELAPNGVTWFEPDGGADALAEVLLGERVTPIPQDWENPYTEERLIPGLAAFFHRLGRKTLSFDGQALMEEVPAGIGTLAAEMTRKAAEDGRFDCRIQAFSRGRSPEQLARLGRFGPASEQIRLCKWFRRGIYLRLWHRLPIPYSLFFPERSDLTVFWNYDVPPGVKGKRLVYVHDMTYMRYPETMDVGVRKLLQRNMADTCRRADRILTLSEFSKSEIIHFLGVDEDKICVVPCGVDHARFHPPADSRALAALRAKYGIEGEYFLYVGTLEPRKNIELLLRAYARLLQTRPGACPKLVLAGRKGWQYDSLLSRMESAALREQVLFTDYLPREELPLLMGGALAFVFPSLYEGFGLPPAEAMACGVPVIVSDRASLPEVVGDAGLVVPVETEEALAAAMLRLMEEPETRRELARRGLERAAQYTWDHAAQCLLAVCEELLETER